MYKPVFKCRVCGKPYNPKIRPAGKDTCSDACDGIPAKIKKGRATKKPK